MAYYDLNEDQLLFKEGLAKGIYLAKNGWKATRILGGEDGVVAKLINPEGEVVDTAFGLHGLSSGPVEGFPNGFSVYPVSYYQQYGREQGETKINAGHLTPGTVVRVEGLNSVPDGDYTVQSLMFNGPGSVMVVTDQIHQGGILDGEPMGFNMDHVKCIVSRVPGVPVFESVVTSTFRVKKRSSATTLMGAAIREVSPGFVQGRHLDDDKLIRHLTAKGLYKGRSKRDLHRSRGLAGFRVFDSKKALKLIKRNPNIMLTSIKKSREIEAGWYEDNSFDDLF